MGSVEVRDLPLFNGELADKELIESIPVEVSKPKPEEKKVLSWKTKEVLIIAVLSFCFGIGVSMIIMGAFGWKVV